MHDFLNRQISSANLFYILFSIFCLIYIISCIVDIFIIGQSKTAQKDLIVAVTVYGGGTLIYILSRIWFNFMRKLHE